MGTERGFGRATTCHGWEDMSRMDGKRRGARPSSAPVKGLVLTRNAGESIVLSTASGRVRVRVLDQGRLAIEAPNDVLILREELMSDGGS